MTVQTGFEQVIRVFVPYVDRVAGPSEGRTFAFDQQRFHGIIFLFQPCSNVVVYLRIFGHVLAVPNQRGIELRLCYMMPVKYRLPQSFLFSIRCVLGQVVRNRFGFVYINEQCFHLFRSDDMRRDLFARRKNENEKYSCA